MGEVTLTINNRSFKLGCDDGEEEHLKILADHIGKHVANLRHTIGKTGDDQLYLMAGLMVCDELWEARELLLKTRELLKQQSSEANAQQAAASQAAPGQALANPPLASRVSIKAAPPVPQQSPTGQAVASTPPAVPPPIPGLTRDSKET